MSLFDSWKDKVYKFKWVPAMTMKLWGNATNNCLVCSKPFDWLSGGVQFFHKECRKLRHNRGAV